MAQKTYYDNGFKFTVDEPGTITAEGKVPTQGVKCGKRLTPDEMQNGDQRGHIIAASEGGGNHPFNVTAQNGKLNQGAYKAVEKNEAKLARQGNDVQTSKTAYVSTQAGNRPDAYMVNDTITTPEGKTQHAYFSFQNDSPEEQQQWSEMVDQYDLSDEYDNPNAAKENMTEKEYTSLMDETENELLTIKDEFDLENASEWSCSNDQQETQEASPSAERDANNFHNTCQSNNEQHSEIERDYVI